MILDKEKHEAWGELKNVVRRWSKHRRDRHHHGHCHHHHHHKKFDILRKITGRAESWFGITLFQGGDYEPSKLFVAGQDKECSKPRLNHIGEHQVPEGFRLPEMLSHPIAPLFQLEYELENEGTRGDDHCHGHRHHRKTHEKWRKTLLHALHRVHDVNNKLRSFERGLISKDGIKGREWFKHLGVAPGKWLGYGATTFPGLTEAIVFDKDKSAAEHELKRLSHLIKKMVEMLRV